MYTIHCKYIRIRPQLYCHVLLFLLRCPRNRDTGLTGKKNNVNSTNVYTLPRIVQHPANYSIVCINIGARRFGAIILQPVWTQQRAHNDSHPFRRVAYLCLMKGAPSTHRVYYYWYFALICAIATCRAASQTPTLSHAALYRLCFALAVHVTSGEDAYCSNVFGEHFKFQEVQLHTTTTSTKLLQLQCIRSWFFSLLNTLFAPSVCDLLRNRAMLSKKYVFSIWSLNQSVGKHCGGLKKITALNMNKWFPEFYGQLLLRWLNRLDLKKI